MKTENATNNKVATPKRTSGCSTVAFHQGVALKRIADTYPSLEEVLLEAVQNALDANARVISVHVNNKTGFITIHDDGDGVDHEGFEEALQSICESKKGQGKLGRFGIGFISPLGKCRLFRFVSCPQGGAFTEWVFESDSICNSRVLNGVPFKARSDLHFREKGMIHGVPWRTLVQIEGFTADLVVSKVSPESLGAQIVDRYGVVLLRNDAKVKITITDSQGQTGTKEVRGARWCGTKLPEECFSEVDAGDTLFRLYLARRSVLGHRRKGKVLIGEVGDDYRIEFGTFADSAKDWLSAEVVEVLKSGVFEGEILTSNGRIHATRRYLDRSLALVGFCATIEEWYRRVGKGLYQKTVDLRKDERHQALALRSCAVIDAFLRSDKSELFRTLFDRFKVGSVGDGHTDIPKRKVIGPEEDNTLSVQGRRKGSQAGGHTNEKPAKEQPDHHPVTAIGPSGKQRTAVRNNSLGLRIGHDMMKGLNKLWVFNEETGTLWFNTLHPAWEECETKDADLMKLQEHVIVQVLTLMLMPEEMRTVCELFQGQLVDPLVFLIRQADTLRKK